MTTETIDFLGHGTSELITMIESQSLGLQPGDVLEITSDNPTFGKDVRMWCDNNRKTLLWTDKDPNCQERVFIKM